MNAVIFPAFRWFVLATLCVVTASTAVALIAPAPLMGPIAKTLGVSLGEATGATMGLFNLFVAISCFIGGWFIDRFGAVRVWIGSLLIIIVGLVLMPVVGTTFGGMSFLRVIQGCGTGPIMGSTAMIAAQWFPVRERGTVTGIQGMSMGLGIAIGFMVAPGIFQSNGNWASTIAWLSAFNILGLLLVLVVNFGPKPPSQPILDNCEAPVGNETDFKLALRRPATWAVAFSVLMLGWIFQGFNDITPGYLAIEAPVGLGKGPMAAGKFMMAVQVAFMIGAVLSGFVTEKVFGGRSKPVVFIGFIGTLVFCSSIKFAGVYSNETTMLICMILAGLFMALVQPTSIAFIAKNYPEHITGRLGGMVQAMSVVGGTMGVFAGATALHTTGNYLMSINIIAIIAIIGLIVSQGQNPPKDFCVIEDQKNLKV
jgi:MFS family permease